MPNILITISYDGTKYSGFQSQPHGNTIQDVLESAVFKLTGEQVKMIGSGRTDAGVHARGQVINFLTDANIPAANWWRALNTMLPKDIVVLNSREVPLQFHARHDAKRKTYRYSISMQRTIDIFHQHMHFHYSRPLNIEEMQKGLAHLIGEHDFSTFCSMRSTKESHLRTVYEAWIECEPSWTGEGETVHIYMTSNGFLYNMVRIIVGTLIEVGIGKRTSDQIGEILKAKNRALAGPTAVAHGLMLWEVNYE